MGIPDNMRESSEEQSTRSYATIAQLTEVHLKVDSVAKQVTSIKNTVEGSLDGTRRIPGLVDITYDLGLTMKVIMRILYGIGSLVATDVVVQALKDFGVIHIR